MPVRLSRVRSALLSTHEASPQSALVRQMHHCMVQLSRSGAVALEAQEDDDGDPGNLRLLGQQSPVLTLISKLPCEPQLLKANAAGHLVLTRLRFSGVLSYPPPALQKTRTVERKASSTLMEPSKRPKTPYPCSNLHRKPGSNPQTKTL